MQRTPFCDPKSFVFVIFGGENLISLFYRLICPLIKLSDDVEVVKIEFCGNSWSSTILILSSTIL